MLSNGIENKIFRKSVKIFKLDILTVSIIIDCELFN